MFDMFPVPAGMDDDVRLSLQDQLVDCIMRVLNARPHLHYYQVRLLNARLHLRYDWLVLKMSLLADMSFGANLISLRLCVCFLLQGYHDIVVTFLLVVGEDATFALMNELSVNHLRYCTFMSYACTCV